MLHRFTDRGKSSGLTVQETQPKGASLLYIGGGKVTRLVAYAPREEAFGDLRIEE